MSFTRSKEALGLLRPSVSTWTEQLLARWSLGGRSRLGTSAWLVMSRRSKCKTKLAFLWKILPQPAEGICLIRNLVKNQDCVPDLYKMPSFTSFAPTIKTTFDFVVLFYTEGF